MYLSTGMNLQKQHQTHIAQLATQLLNKQCIASDVLKQQVKPRPVIVLRKLVFGSVSNSGQCGDNLLQHQLLATLHQLCDTKRAYFYASMQHPQILHSSETQLDLETALKFTNRFERMLTS